MQPPPVTPPSVPWPLGPFEVGSATDVISIVLGLFVLVFTVIVALRQLKIMNRQTAMMEEQGTIVDEQVSLMEEQAATAKRLEEMTRELRRVRDFAEDRLQNLRLLQGLRGPGL